MNTIKRTLLTVGVSALCILTNLAQTEKSNFSADQNNQPDSKTITAGAGFSLAGLLIRGFQNILVDSISANGSVGRVTRSSIPVLILSYDYTLAKHFSIGLAGSYQSWIIKIDPYYNHGTPYAGATLAISRSNLALRPLFHFGRNPDLDLYAGMRLGYTIWAVKTDSPDPSVRSANSELGDNFAPAFIFGIRHFFTHNIGFNSEASVGAPYTLAIGINFRFD